MIGNWHSYINSNRLDSRTGFKVSRLPSILQCKVQRQSFLGRPTVTLTSLVVWLSVLTVSNGDHS